MECIEYREPGKLKTGVIFHVEIILEPQSERSRAK
jgi:hypothetical protein